MRLKILKVKRASRKDKNAHLEGHFFFSSCVAGDFENLQR